MDESYDNCSYSDCDVYKDGDKEDFRVMDATVVQTFLTLLPCTKTEPIKPGERKDHSCLHTNFGTGPEFSSLN